MHEERLDLSSIELEPERRELLVAAIMARAASGLRARRSARGVLVLVGMWRRPVIAASALITAASVAALLLGSGTAEAVPVATADLYDALQLEQPVREWLSEGRGPTMVDLVSAVEDGF
ncbi:MAG TPA: hypothetical protein VMM18_04200 [Gemmatimonadaceae bacterium]|nr:hypothetical protein [Gemmatimonadaceae bacterium]